MNACARFCCRVFCCKTGSAVPLAVTNYYLKY